mmetsp:Transcript_16352/g.28676  ORF Transcript_16352/g.28676 Transcript_16352/m.28676 type:complete len:381 (-) Transcript_16352:117-1259(-)|eukprot:CAMPEP_0197654920 /NCGR_PEP_ID=MMETSP1338-20131121/39136_1 /TAXON_ID=43686 ORGANISM="Pelagodinium beii, Strain RCC1491" /NCGR_SAMPLE_ID=MMETSP1338 /ASSEMBLY_ACC=CAM_ASM_000754 /LENGTH=380 /DNA_ID=CAMNT_0043230455 /DNA_START=63 /DNA_END=1205 /DNA_ORIENTATION=-
MTAQRQRLAMRSFRGQLSRLSVILAIWMGAGYSGLFAFISNGATHNGSKISMRAGTTLEKPRVSSEWRLGVGKAIDVLRRDMRGLFENMPYTPDFSIYSPDIEVQDARLPSFRLKGIATYEQVLSTLQWSVRTTCDRSVLEITSVSPPVNNEMYMRWKLKLWFKDVRSLLVPGFGAPNNMPSIDGPFIVEGYSRYTFDPWSAEIVKHTIDITNPPTYLQDLVARTSAVPTWLMTPASTGFGVPTAISGEFKMPVGFKRSSGEQVMAGGSSPKAKAASSVPQEGSPLTGATTPSSRADGAASSVARAAGGWLPGLPQGCEDDFECNDGKANYPLQCCELPVMGKFCCEPPDDYEQGIPQMPAWLPLPVPVDEAPWESGGKY